MATIFWDCEGILLFDYKDKDVNITGPYFANTLRQLWEAINEKRQEAVVTARSTYEFCSAAKTLYSMNNPVANAKLQSVFCGRDSANLAMVCCSELMSDSRRHAVDHDDDIEPDSVDSHPNLSLLPAQCGKIDGEKIIGGLTAGLYEFPWMVLIAHKKNKEVAFKCGGTLINERYVLTAAHCVVNKTLAGVRVGEHDVETATDCQGEAPGLVCESHNQDIRVEEAIPHPDYPRQQHDIALLRLKKPVNLNFKNVGMVCLPVTKALRNSDTVGRLAIVTGWGFTEKGYRSSRLLAVVVPIHDSATCAQNTMLHNRFKQDNRSDEETNKICAGEEGKDSCTGDSGGPLMLKGEYKSIGQRYIEYGIVSYGPLTCGSDKPAVYTDVTKYMKWILDNMRS